MYKVIVAFTDLQDNEHAYKVGDTFPRLGAEASDKRLAELSTEHNKQGKPLIVRVPEEEKSEVAPKSRVKKKKE